MSLQQIYKRLRTLADSAVAEHSQRFFKTGPGEYGEGDQFRGIRVPVLRKLAREFKSLSLDETVKLLHSKWHEQRLLALLMMVNRFARADEIGKKEVYSAYLENMPWINNWDLVDTTCMHIVGGWLYPRKRTVLYDLAQSEVLWERRIAIIASFYFIKQGDFSDTLKLSKQLLNDSHDLMHKAVGWMLREVGKRDLQVEEQFLKEYYNDMPRTMLRYAIEKFPEDRRQAYLRGTA